MCAACTIHRWGFITILRTYYFWVYQKIPTWKPYYCHQWPVSLEDDSLWTPVSRYFASVPFLTRVENIPGKTIEKYRLFYDIMTTGVCVCVCVCVYWGACKLGQGREKLKQRSYIWRINIFINLHNDFINPSKQIFLWLCGPKFSNCFVS